jgi:hypothetical protein
MGLGLPSNLGHWNVHVSLHHLTSLTVNVSEGCSLWIPLRPIEEEDDAEKAQKLEEMIVMLRKVS